MENDIVTILQRHGVSPLSPDHDYNDDDDDNNSGPWALDVEEPSGADTMATIVRHDPTSYSWAHHDKKKRKKDKEIRFRKLPLDYNAFEIEFVQSVPKVRCAIQSANPTTGGDSPCFCRVFTSICTKPFKKAKAVTTMMGQLLREDEAGRTLIEVFEKSNTIASLTEMSEEAQRRLLGDLPPPIKRQKRSNPEN